MYVLDVSQIRDYCSRLFDFKTIQVKRFSTWNARHNHRRKIVQARNTYNLVSIAPARNTHTLAACSSVHDKCILFGTCINDMARTQYVSECFVISAVGSHTEYLLYLYMW